MDEARSKATLQERGQAAEAATPETLAARIGPGPWLVVVPHDDDLVLGSGMLLAAAADAGIEVHVAVCTDGALGYTHPEDRERIGAVRRVELERAMQVVGLDPPRTHYLGFADGSLARQQGARPAPEPPGLGQALAALMRRVRPGAVFACHERDVHPDHRAVAREAAIAGFWAASAIWLELGEPIAQPAHWLYGVYVGFDGPPDLRVRVDAALFERKLGALACFESQTVIEALVARVRADGAEEYFQRAAWPPHGPAAYAAYFEGTP